MKKLAALASLVAAPAYAHPGSFTDHAGLSHGAHSLFFFLPCIAFLAVLGLAAFFLFRRRA